MKEHPYNPYTRARENQHYIRLCTRCGSELEYWRDYRHQHWHWGGRRLDDIVEIDGVVYLKCACGNHMETNLKPMTASMPCDLTVK